ncbi:fibronectin type III domain-containing protein [Paenibacillus sp. MZ04-78.2]|uniref:fibronectin type III domain-containing protein n=1 Tax=Paenibacillus sp. MZ04-78.2 TaxID=2962034 RepID=UPI0020B6543B|nr:fibronectin type III domain-containing protein [Paenibacillus sp. MZ04-78.2]MCP3775636.1 fibronectin type III domain-containing protein [Paenibacillus sp. MZ04-78.2]
MTAPTSGLSIGKHKLEILAWDHVGLQSSYITNFTVAPAPSGPVWPEGSTLSASNVTSSSLTLNWTTAQGATGYRIYRDSSVASSVYGSVYSYDIGGLQSDTTYTFSVEAVDAAGNVSPNNPATTVKTKAAQGTTEAFRLQAWPGFLNAGFTTRVGQPGYDRMYDLYNDGVIDGTDVKFVADKVAG